MRKYRFVLLMTLTFTLLIVATGFTGRALAPDVLVYKLDNFNGKPSSLNLYDPASGMTAPLILNGGFGNYSLSANGRLAYTLGENGQSDIFIWDLHALGQKPVNITQTQEVNERVLSWSPDGRYLAFESTNESNLARIYLWDGAIPQDITPHDIPENVVYYGTFWSADGHELAIVSYDKNNHALISVWDGEKVLDITPQNMPDSAKSYDIDWSPNGRLAFAVRFRLDSPSEIYLWDGLGTMNLSQSPADGESRPVWSNDGKLAFQSEQDGKYAILVWDGVSFKNGAPDVSTFTSVAPGMIGYYSFPSWTPQGQVAFISQTAQDTSIQIYVWDGKTATNISQNPNFHNGSPVWNRDGLWAFMTYFSAPRLYVRDEQGHTLLTTEGESTFAWSSNGHLMFCNRDSFEWNISVWNGTTITQVARAREVSAEWQSGSGVFCSSG